MQQILAKMPQVRSLGPGVLVEWGIPHGHWGRLIALSFVQPQWLPCVWIYNASEGEVYPPSFAAQGLPLDKIFFISSQEPLKELRPLFLENTFKFIIIDSPKVLKAGDLAFLASKIRENQQIVFIIRPYYLSAKRGNPFSLLRINCSFSWRKQQFRLQFIKGGHPQPIYISQQEVLGGSQLSTSLPSDH